MQRVEVEVTIRVGPLSGSHLEHPVTVVTCVAGQTASNDSRAAIGRAIEQALEAASDNARSGVAGARGSTDW